MDIKKFLLKWYDEKKNCLTLDNTFLSTSSIPHTKSVKHLSIAHEGRKTANLWALKKITGLPMDSKESLEILKAISTLQDTDEKSDFYGCMRWYAEETYIADSNAAFFTISPLYCVYAFAPETITVDEDKILKEIFFHGIHWFERECSDSILYYPNKIMSDGSLFLSLSILIDDKNRILKAENFWKRWLQYTDNRGWGWGENMSAGYGSVMAAALSCTISNCKNDEISAQLSKKLDILLDYAVFHGRFAYCPGIRNYNFDGSPNALGSLAFATGNIPSSANFSIPLNDISQLVYIMSYCENKHYIINQPIPRTKEERIFDNSYGYTWIGNGITLGSINRYPVLNCDGCLDWQSMPISFIIHDEIMGWLRTHTKSRERIATRPAKNYPDGYLTGSIFKDEKKTGFVIRSAQKDNIMLICREIPNIANEAEFIADELFIPSHSAKVYEKTISDRKWTIMEFEKSAIAVLPLLGIKESSDTLEEIDTRIINYENGSAIAQVLYEGENKLIRKSRLMSTWVIVGFENKETLENELKSIVISDKTIFYPEEPRNSLEKIRNIDCSFGDITVNLTVDVFRW